MGRAPMTTALSGALALLAAVLAGTADGPARPHIAGIAHMAIYVHDIEKSRAFYRDFLGYDEPYHLDNPDGSLAMTFFKVNEHQYIEVFPEKAAATDRLYHIAIETDNAEGLRQYLAAKGVKVPDKVGSGGLFREDFDV